MTKLLFFILLIPVLSFGQRLNSTEKGGQGNIYNDAIERYITFVSKSNNSVFDTLIIQKDDLLTDSLMAVIRKTKIVVADSIGVAAILKREGSFILYKLFPLSFHNGKFWIKIVPFRVHRDMDETYFENTGTGFISYNFDSKGLEFKPYRVSFSGY